ncbi:Stromal interaction molecule 2 Precursor [Channa argus]|uniref:Stromal interaction molecule 2 n=1 Tax=Channa argus TaxID=215402 RepID=A0A6G1PBD2_CHAAH|nr:Stromal interaction molecule 2 Precursor [Channa argus]
MLPLSPLFLLVFPAALFVAAQGTGDLQGYTFPGGSAAVYPADPCMVVSPPCMSEADHYSLEALRNIHHMMDDDQDGGIEVEESVEFIIEDMKQQQTNKHSNLHREDQHITVEELWRGWKSSEVHNWTQDEVLQWLKEFVELPQYERNFKEFKVNGNTLPRIAANEPSFLSGQLKVQDQRDKQKLNIKALDVVLFGPPIRPPHNYMKDLLLIVSVVMGVGGCWFAQAQNKESKIHIGKMMKDLESLQRAEQSLIDLQEQLEQAQEEKRNVAEEKQNLEEKMRDEIMGAQEEAHRLHELRQGAVCKLSRLRYAEEELEQIRGALKQAEKDMQACWTASEALQQWLQLTHEIEIQYYNVKRHSAELQLATAKEEAERIKKKRSSVLGTLHVAHSSSLDQVDRKILEAKSSLTEVTACLRERLHRWQQIELLCGFPIFRNPGLANLTAQLYSESFDMGFPRMPQSTCSCHCSMQESLEDLLDECDSPILPQMPVQLSPLKRSPRNRGSTLCHSRRHGVTTQPPIAMISSDPDLLIPIRASYSCFEEEESLFLKKLKKQNSQERFSDTDYMTSPPLSKIFPSSTIDPSSRKLYHDETELLTEGSITKPLTKEVESAIHKMSREEFEASVDVACRKIPKNKVLDPTFEIPSLKMSKAESLIDTASRKITRDRAEPHLDVVVRKGLSTEIEADFPTRKADRDVKADLMDNTSWNMYREKGDLSLNVRKILCNEFETSSDVAPRKTSRDTMGTSFDSTSRKMMQDDVEHPLESVSRWIKRDPMGVSLDTCSKKLSWHKGENQLDSSVRASAMDKMVEGVRTRSKRISRDELDYCTDTASYKMLPRENTEALIDTSSKKQELGLEASTGTRIQRDEVERPAGSLRRRKPRMPEDELDRSTENPTGTMSWDRPAVEIPLENHKDIIEEVGASQSSLGSASGYMGQPDLMVSSQIPWKSSSDLFSSGPLSQLVYDGILEKSCNSMATSATSLSASATNLPQSKLPLEVETSVLPPRVAFPSPASSTETGDERNKNKEKSKKSLKLKNLFK